MQGEITKHKYRKALAAVAVGWYLIRPPVSWNNQVLKDVPMNHWEQVHSFDSAQQCEQYRSWLTHQQEPTTVAPGHDPVPGTVWAEISNLAQCVSADDSRISEPQPVRPYMPVYP